MSENKLAQLVIIVRPRNIAWTEAYLRANKQRAIVVAGKRTPVESLRAASEILRVPSSSGHTHVRIVLNGGLAHRLEPISRGDKGAVPLWDGEPMLMHAVAQTRRFPDVCLRGETVFSVMMVDTLLGGLGRVSQLSIVARLRSFGCAAATAPYVPNRDYRFVKGFAFVESGSIISIADAVYSLKGVSRSSVRELAGVVWFTSSWARRWLRGAGDFFGTALVEAATKEGIGDIFLGNHSWTYDMGTVGSYAALMRWKGLSNSNHPVTPLVRRANIGHWTRYLADIESA